MTFLYTVDTSKEIREMFLYLPVSHPHKNIFKTVFLLKGLIIFIFKFLSIFLNFTCDASIRPDGKSSDLYIFKHDLCNTATARTQRVVIHFIITNGAMWEFQKQLLLSTGNFMTRR